MKPSSAPLQKELASRLSLALGHKNKEGALRDLQAALADGADPDTRLNDPAEIHPASPALGIAVRSKRPWAKDMALILLRAGANPLLEKDGRQAIHIAARFGRADTVKALIGEGHSAKNATKDGWTPFLCAAARGEFKLCEFLAPFSDVNACADDGSGDMKLRADAAGLFLKGGNPKTALKAYHLGWGDPGLVGNSRWTPLIRAIQAYCDDLVDLAAQDPRTDRGHRDFDDQTAMHYAVAANRPDYVRLLAAHGHLVDGFDKEGMTPLSDAMRLGHFDCARSLLDVGADPAARVAKPSRHAESGSPGADALHMAISSSRHEAFELGSSFAHRCSPHTRNLESNSCALHYAARHSDPILAGMWTRKLLDLGWLPHSLDMHGQTPLMAAMGSQNLGAMAALLPVSDLSHQSKAGLDALGVCRWLASDRGQSAPLDMLLSHLDQVELLADTPQGPKAKTRSI